jgi:hypothetical protein
VRLAGLRYKGARTRTGGRTEMTIGGRSLLKALLAVAAMHVLMGEGAVADGAVAVGSTGDVVKHGIAFGMVANEPKEKAADLALARCKAFVKGSSVEATARCKVVATFSRECFAVAYDPKPATPGAGWGVGKDQIDANLNAMKMCEATAGPARAKFCQVESGGCDTSN